MQVNVLKVMIVIVAYVHEVNAENTVCVISLPNKQIIASHELFIAQCEA